MDGMAILPACEAMTIALAMLKRQDFSTGSTNARDALQSKNRIWNRASREAGSAAYHHYR
jgi:hypothetical protein